MADTTDVYKTMDLALRVGELLLSSGAGAADVKAQMTNVARSCGLRNFSVDITYTELAMSHSPVLDQPALIQLRQVQYRQVDFGDLTLVDHLVRDLAAGRATRDEAVSRLNRIVSSGHSRPRWAVTLGLGVMGGGIAVVLNAPWLAVITAFVGACAIDVVQQRMTRTRWPVFYQQVAGGLIATLLAAAVAKTGLDIAPSRIITAGIVLLLAGVSFLGAVQDALTGFPLTAGARILDALLATAGAIAGVSGGITLAKLIGIGLGTLDPGSVRFADQPMVALGAAVTAAAYAYSGYVPYRALLPIAAISAAAVSVYAALDHRGAGIAWASGVAALVVGLVAYAVASRFRVPALVVVSAAVVPLLPGLSIYRGLALLGAGSEQGLLAMVTAGAVTIALSSGAILGEYIAQPLKREARRLETRLAGPRLVGPLTVPHRRPRRRRAGDRTTRRSARRPRLRP